MEYDIIILIYMYYLDIYFIIIFSMICPWYMICELWIQTYIVTLHCIALHYTHTINIQHKHTLREFDMFSREILELKDIELMTRGQLLEHI